MEPKHCKLDRRSPVARKVEVACRGRVDGVSDNEVDRRVGAGGGCA